MMATLLTEPVALVLERDVPVRMAWKGERFYVDGVPEPLGRTAHTGDGAAPHPSLVTGWRFRATTPGGESHGFDVVSTGMSRWQLRAIRD